MGKTWASRIVQWHQNTRELLDCSIGMSFCHLAGRNGRVEGLELDAEIGQFGRDLVEQVGIVAGGLAVFSSVAVNSAAVARQSNGRIGALAAPMAAAR